MPAQVFNGVTVYEPTASLEGATSVPTGSDAISLIRIGTFTGSGATAATRAESISFDIDTGRFLVTNAAAERIDIGQIGADAKIASAGSIDLAALPGYGEVNSVAVKNGVVAVAYQNATGNLNGAVALFDAETGALIKRVEVGVLPDQLTFTPDGSKLLVANEAEALSVANNPLGSISVIDMSGGAQNAQVATTIGFSALTGYEAQLRALGLQIHPGFAAGADLEPEYISVSPDGTRAYVTLQEVSAVAVIDLTDPSATRPIAIQPLGWIDHALAGNAFDPTDTGGTPSFYTLNVRGLPQPDAIATFEVDGATYFVTANEGDARVGTGIADTDVARLSSGGITLDTATYTAEEIAVLKSAPVSRLNVFSKFGNTDADAAIEQLHTLGGRGISIFRVEEDGSITKVRETGGEFERIIARDAAAIFNQNQGVNPDSRSDDKGPEPEGVAIGVVDGKTYAFVVLERTGGVMVYDVSDPENASFVEYMPPVAGKNGALGPDEGPETIVFVSAADSPTGHPLVLTANEVSGTVTVYQVGLDGDGGKGSDFLSGGAGADDINGGPGDDTVIGLGGADDLQGQSGADVFLFTRPADGGDTITGFAQGDKIGILRAGFGLSADADLAHGVAFVSGKGATAAGAGPTLVYDTKAGDLFFDADGAGGVDPVLLAHIKGQPLSSSDFLFV